ncbi:MAG: hypothetical protein HN348_03785 [Proteobacteria bacterium]|jgi:hypothetical protein|nr:hypothetical protein [Pseudomonadota bacterium]
MQRILIPLLLSLASTPALADTPISWTLVVLDGEQTPISHAVVRFASEGDRHAVNTVNGKFTESHLYPHANTIAFEPGLKLDFLVLAAGYQPLSQSYVFEKKKKKQTLTVTLEPMDLSVSMLKATNSIEKQARTCIGLLESGDMMRAEDCSHDALRQARQFSEGNIDRWTYDLLAIRGIAALLEYRQTYLEAIEEGHMSPVSASRSMRARAYGMVSVWMSHAQDANLDQDRPKAVCQIVADDPAFCDY